MIDYGVLIKEFKELKSLLTSKIGEEKLISEAQQGRKTRSTKQEQEILVALQSSGDEGIRLSALFNTARARQTVVTSLYKALKEGKLLERAIEILKSYESTERDEDDNFVKIELKRICWCLIKKRLG